ncbi:MAG: DUF3858 domain-containing protein [Bacteroidota bacterium]|nr:DUF3858 domain-containing protein [Bacteroidota bacterium]
MASWCCASPLAAQEIRPVEFGKLWPGDFTLHPSAVLDSSNAAVIIADYGETTFKGNSHGWVSYVFTHKKRIKILDSRAFDLATIEVILYSDGEQSEQLEDLTAASYNLKGDTILVNKVDKKDIFTDKIDKNRVVKKFTVPGVKENCIIEYSYTIVSDFYFNIPSWEFQHRGYPTLWSEYKVEIPAMVTYVFNKRGYHSFDIDEQGEGKATYQINRANNSHIAGIDMGVSVKSKTVKHRWVMKDMEAFGHEDYLYTPENYLDQIDFQLSKTFNGEETSVVKNTWAKQTEDMLRDKQFASFMSGEEDMGWMDDYLAASVHPSGSPIEQVRQVYNHISGNFSCIDHHSKYLRSSMQAVAKAQKGSVGEINLLLTALLRRLHFEAAPVVLSTREAGFNDESYPVLTRLDYVVCRVMVDDAEYYLDASQPQLGFGQLPPNCYNGHARVISPVNSKSVFFLADSIKETHKVMLHFFPSGDPAKPLAGSCVINYGMMESFNSRVEIAAKGLPAYLRRITGIGGEEMQIKESWVDSLDKKELPISVHFNVDINSFNGSDIVYFSPVLWSGYKKNPFAALTRRYPVEMSYPLNETYYLTLEVPEGYEIDELPKSIKISYNANQGYFEYIVRQYEGTIQLRSTILLKKALFDAEDYNSLRTFFADVVKKQAEQIVFKKKK